MKRSNGRSGFNGAPLHSITRATIEEMILMDPSEAVDSEQIVPKLPEYFENLEMKKYGGTILHLFLNHIVANFDTENEQDAVILKMTFLQERTLKENNVLSSDFLYVVARPTPSTRN